MATTPAPSKVVTRTFCFCIPTRVGVVFIGFLGLIGGAGIAAIGIINVKKAEGSKTAAIIQIVVYLLLSILSIFGLVGAVTKRLAFIRLYFVMLLAHLIFSIATGVFSIHHTFKDSAGYIHDCASGSEEESVLGVCRNGATILKAVMISSYIIAWLLQLWGSVIVIKYSKQLADEEKAKNAIKDTEAW